MGLQLTLILSCLFISKALGLNCYLCVAQTCNSNVITEVNCPSLCASVHKTSTTTIDGLPAEFFQMSFCAQPADCVSGSLNLGILNSTLYTQCCNTDLCNNRTLAALPQQFPNGKSCYTCDGNTCSGTVRCQGDENQCMSATVYVGNKKVALKGCATKNMCNGTSTLQETMGIANATCCEGSLCNSVNRIDLSFLLILGPLLSSFFIH